MTDQKLLIIVLIVAVLCMVWGCAKAWPAVPVWLVGALVATALALAVVAGVL